MGREGGMTKTIFCLYKSFCYMEWLFSVSHSLLVGWLSLRMEITFSDVFEWEETVGW